MARIELIRACEPVVGLLYCLLYLHQVLLRVDLVELESQTCCVYVSSIDIFLQSKPL